MFKTPLAMHFGYFGQKIRFREEKSSRSVSVTPPKAIMWKFFIVLRRSSPFFIHSLFVLRSSTGNFSNPRLSIHFLFCVLSL